ncbi:MAG TPA: hypothetical protein VKU87_04240 [Thermomicrobiaceae bacterium]|nr:hypothetical protein [Thermomicrobiaceae bacterium]
MVELLDDIGYESEIERDRDDAAQAFSEWLSQALRLLAEDQGVDAILAVEGVADLLSAAWEPELQNLYHLESRE